MWKCHLTLEGEFVHTASEYDQEIPLSHTANHPRHREEEQHDTYSHNTSLPTPR